MKLRWFWNVKVGLCVLLLCVVLVLRAQTGVVRANGLMLVYESFGKTSNPAIVLINGTGAPMTDWPVNFCKKLAEHGYRVIRFDNRDAGLSTKLDSLGVPDWAKIAPFVKTCKPAPLPYTLLDMAKDAIGLMDALIIKKANIVGASMGGAIAQLLAINFPNRVLTLTTLSASSGDPGLPPANPKAVAAMSTPPPSTRNEDTLANYLINVYRALGTTDNEATLRRRALEQVRRSWHPEGAARQVAAILIADNCDRRPQLAQIKIPTMVVHGDKDPLVSVEAAKEIAAIVPHAELHIIKGMGHDLSQSFVDQLVAIVVRNAGKGR
jgi:pimeloyl-ACP methyl ester carboxylesterase